MICTQESLLILLKKQAEVYMMVQTDQPLYLIIRIRNFGMKALGSTDSPKNVNLSFAENANYA